MPRFYAAWLAIWLLAFLPQLAAAAPPTLVIRGLGSGSADVMAFVDQVQILDASGNVVAGAVGDASFETVSAGGSYAYQPTGSAWAFGGSGSGGGPGAGLAANGSALAPPPAPDGTQAAFVQRTGYLRQALTLAPGTYQVQFAMAQRPGNAATQQLQVLVLGQSLGVASLGSSTAYARYTSGTFTVAGGLVGASPAANSLRAPRQHSALRLSFSPSVKTSTVPTIGVYSALVGGRKAGTWSGDGAPTVSFQSNLAGTQGDFQPGEVVSVSVPTTVQTTSGSSVPPQVFQFTAAVDGPGRGNFVAPAASPSVPAPAGTSTAVGDVDNDGDLDVLVSSTASGNGTVLVRLNDGQGNFSGATSVSVGKNPSGLALGDWDGDGDLDLATANADDNTVSVRINDGTGSFRAPYINDPVPVGNSPRSLAVGDVDGDGDLDVLAANYADNTVTFCSNSGQGFFYNVASVSVGGSPTSVAVGDVDNDGDLDLLTANGAAGTVSVRLNNGAGNFTAPAANADFAVGSSPTSVAVGDVNGDGALDVLVASGTGTVSVRLNDGTGSFGGGSDPTVGSDPRSVALGDVDSDGDLDLLTANGAAGTVSVRLNDGTGQFAAPASNADFAGPGAYTFGVALGDVDGDGDLDALAASGGGSGAVSVQLNQPFPPSLTAASPAAAGVGIPVTLIGSALGNTTGVTVGGVAATITANSATSLTFTVPAGAAAGSAPVVVTTSGGSATRAFTVLAAPGNALAFDGGNDYVSLPATVVAALQNDFTLEYWVRTTQTGTGSSGDQWWQGTGLLDGDVSGLAADYGTSLLGGRVAFGVGGGSTTNDVTVQSTTLVNDGRWHYVVATRHASTGQLSLYVDGQAQASATGSTAARTAPPQLTLGVAQTGTADSNFLAGSLDEVRLWSVVRSAADVAAAYQAGPQTNLSQSGLAAYYSFDEGQPGASNPDLTALYDLTANARQGTLHNYALSGAASNFVASYALVVPTATAATNQATGSFTANWTAPVVGQLDSYLLDVATTADFGAPVAGSPFTVAAGTTSRDVTGLAGGHYYYRVRAELASLTGQGALSNAIAVDGPLPVQLASFTAQEVTGASAVRLAWTTASEVNSAYFTIERSPDGTQFTGLSQVAAAGTSATTRTYNYLDASAPAGRLYYRLRQVDRDGTAAYSPVRSVVLAGAGLAVFPNPARSSARLAGAEAGAPVLVLDALGRLVLQATADAAGVAQLALPTGLASGVYVVRTGGHSLRLAVE